MKIVSLKNTKKSQPNLFKATMDDDKVFELHADAIVEYGISVGDELDEHMFMSALQKTEWLVACANAVNFLSRQLKTKKQLQTYLYKKGYSTDTVNKLVDKMTDYNLVNDENYAKTYSASLQKSKSKMYIKNKLREAGVKNEIIDESVEDIDDRNTASRIVEKYFFSHPADQKSIEKLIRHLQYKGYTWDTINFVLKNYKEEICE